MIKTNHSRPIDWFRPEITGKEIELISDVLKSGYINDGPITRKFEEKIANFLGVKYCVAVTSGTAAISLALLASGVKADDDVLVPNFTFIATANAVSMIGANVKLVDIEKTNLSINCLELESLITEKTKAIVTVDVNGRPANYERIIELCNKYGLRLITDSAEALGSTYLNNKIGSLGDASCFSFSPNKVLTTGQGGMIATNDYKIYQNLLELKDQGRPVRGTGGDDKHNSIGFNFKFTDIQAAVGIAQFNRLSDRINKAKLRDYWYRSNLKGIKGIKILGDNNYHDTTVTTWFDLLVEDRDKLIQELIGHNIGYRPFWFPLNTQPSYKNRSLYINSEEVSRSGLWLPSTFDISKEDVDFICSIIEETTSSGT